MNKHICIHGHFYQPPRENAWLEVIEYQDSAYPFHDWNERINTECYAPNAASRILDNQGLIKKISNNYEKISFNFGPTLLSWLEQEDPETYRAILEADKVSQQRFSGHGNAIAQVHSHLIIPLANRRDRETQIIWGIKDFEHRFQRKPEGIWLAETAVDSETLELLVEHDIRYTILAPRQAKAFRKTGNLSWTPLAHAAIDPRRPYWCQLPNGKHIALFFYDGRVAQDVAFNNLLHNGRLFADRIIQTLDATDFPQLAHIATDGESYGHHHRYGDMALAAALDYIDQHDAVFLTNYGEYLEKYPPQHEVEIYENSSWSCVHGVERWRSDCGCHTGGKAGWTQAWRKPLREALNWLRDELIEIYEREASKLLRDPWAARNAFIQVVLDRSDENVETFLEEHAYFPPTPTEKIQLLRLLELQRNAMLMFTSCGWFFNEISGIETIQILQYACRTIYYAKQIANIDLEQTFIQKLAAAKSNLAEYDNGAEIYKKLVIPMQVGLKRTGMHYAVSSLFEKHPETLPIFNYIATSETFNRQTAGRLKLAWGRTMVKSSITHSEKHFSFAVLYLGQQHIVGHISLNMNVDVFIEMQIALKEAFKNSQIGRILQLMRYYFGQEQYSIHSLFKDQKIKILNQLLAENLEETERSLRAIYNDNYHLMNTLRQDKLLVINQFKEIVQFVLNADLRNYFKQPRLSVKELKRIVSEFKKWNVRLEDQSALKRVANNSLLKVLQRLEQHPTDLRRLQKINEIFELLETLDFKIEGWKPQNLYFHIVRKVFTTTTPQNAQLLVAYRTVGAYLGVGVDFGQLVFGR